MSETNDSFDCKHSKTYIAHTGCGKLFVTVVFFDRQIIRVIAHRKSSFECDVTFFEALNRQTTFMTNRELDQVIYDLKGNEDQREGHFCKNYSIAVKAYMKKGLIGAYSCTDAVARVLEKAIEEMPNE